MRHRIAGDAQPSKLGGIKKGNRILGFGADDLEGKNGYDRLKGGKGDGVARSISTTSSRTARR